MPLWVWVILSYVAGSIPFGVIIGLAKGVDLRKVGSGNVGATNVGRVLGRKWGLLCFALDLLKGMVPVLAAGFALGYIHQRALPPDQAWRWLSVAAAAVVGHVFPLWLGFKGGKGVATGLGALLGVWPILTLPALATFALWGLVLWIFRYVSLASIVAAAALPILTYIAGSLRDTTVSAMLPFLAVTSALSVLVILRHRANLARLIAGTENRIGQSKPK